MLKGMYNRSFWSCTLSIKVVFYEDSQHDSKLYLSSVILQIMVNVCVESHIKHILSQTEFY